MKVAYYEEHDGTKVPREGWMTTHPLTNEPVHVVRREWLDDLFEQYEDLQQRERAHANGRVHTAQRVIDLSEELRQLKEQVETLQANEKDWSDQAWSYCEQIAGLKEQLEAAHKALAFYADEKTWTQPTSWGGRIIDDEGPWLSDTGKRARDVLYPASSPKTLSPEPPLLTDQASPLHRPPPWGTGIPARIPE